MADNGTSSGDWENNLIDNGTSSGDWENNLIDNGTSSGDRRALPAPRGMRRQNSGWRGRVLECTRHWSGRQCRNSVFVTEPQTPTYLYTIKECSASQRGAASSPPENALSRVMAVRGSAEVDVPTGACRQTTPS
ncbi:hypothetical protein BaRGS_00011636, partial [Batillaria attramentaria]